MSRRFFRSSHLRTCLRNSVRTLASSALFLLLLELNYSTWRHLGKESTATKHHIQHPLVVVNNAYDPEGVVGITYTWLECRECGERNPSLRWSDSAVNTSLSSSPSASASNRVVLRVRPLGRTFPTRVSRLISRHCPHAIIAVVGTN